MITAHGKAIVGTVSGTSISFGSEVTFNGSSTFYTGLSFDAGNSGTFVVTYGDAGNSSRGTAIIGTISGTSISFGSEYVFSSSTTHYTNVAFDPSTAGVFVVTYTDAGNSNYGTAKVGTLSGTSTSYGSAVVFNALP